MRTYSSSLNRFCRTAAALLVPLLLLLSLAAAEDHYVVDKFKLSNAQLTSADTFWFDRLNETVKVLSTAEVLSSTVQGVVQMSCKTHTAPDDLATTLIFRFKSLKVTNGQLFIRRLPPNSFLHFSSLAHTATESLPCIRIGYDSMPENSTLYLQDPSFSWSGNTGAYAFVLDVGADASPFSFPEHSGIRVTYLRATNAAGVLSIYNPTTFEVAEEGGIELTQSSFVAFDGPVCTSCTASMFRLGNLTVMGESAVSFLQAAFSGPTNPAASTMVQAESIHVSEDSIFTTYIASITYADANQQYAHLFNVTKDVTGSGYVSMVDMKIPFSGLTTPQPLNNSRFWVSTMNPGNNAYKTPDELKAMNFNVNDDNFVYPGGTDADGNCMHTGRTVPGRAKYTKLGNVCSSKCTYPFIEPACLSPYSNPCLVDNCELCYRTTRGKCLSCRSKHTKSDNEEHCFSCAMSKCKTCYDDNKCLECDAKYKPSPDNSTCVECVVDHCNSCSEKNVCANCEEGYSNVDGRCVPCAVDNCQFCTEDNVCHQCDDKYSMSDDNSTCFRCDIESCESCGDHDMCRTCDDRYTLSFDNKTCIECHVDGCQRCDFPGSCALCGTNLTSSMDGNCTTCAIANCSFCAAENSCEVCECGMVPSHDNSECLPCSVTNCLYCTMPGDGRKCSQCIEGFEPTSSGACRRVILPSWGILLVLIGCMAVTAVIVVTIMLVISRRNAKRAQDEKDAEERRKNRQVPKTFSCLQTAISVVDIADIEGAASGVRDDIKQLN